MRYIKYSKDKKKLRSVVSTEMRFKSVEREAVEIINAVTGSNMKVSEGKESVDVCIAIQGMMEDSRIEGRTEGIIEGAITFAEELGIPREEVKRSLMAKYGKNEEEAEELMETYWK